MEKIVLIGAGTHCKVIIDALGLSNNYEILGALDNKINKHNKTAYSEKEKNESGPVKITKRISDREAVIFALGSRLCIKLLLSLYLSIKEWFIKPSAG